ncbi:hypothetical protein JI721_03205 [Alicyclobacillus cycloheptanicus]|uniref:Tyr recombinase domain-containing protein n=1 Tax=Alicyclobacillus cycloheptanicus TaxID=1457 RepID=A0ABT9XLD6_9BACL|nr:hypothetical protein [Alicyclobacillus cycloheptanicus]MDQ0191125.1 hypothetical protein [Alicyclobacillus cycloheptanicus]WDM01868.1 hypothetical protein JI721_03205 [Alicyclobacillus cycloheptanicus]
MKHVDYRIVLPPGLVTEIERYVEFRRANGFRYGNHYFAPYKKASRVENQRDTLLKLFFLILCSRSGIDFNRGGETNELSFREYSFELQSFGAQDMEHLERYFAPTTFYTMCKAYLLPFLKFQLATMKRQLNIDDDDDYRKFRRITYKYEDAFEVVPPFRPEPEEPRRKVYLNRKEILQVYAVIRDPLLFPQKWRKYSVEFMTGCFLALRNLELCDLRIEHFVLNSQGFIQPDEDGFGLLLLPDDISKGGYSGSKPGLGTLVVPRLVTLLNEYFAHLYEATKGKSVGKGYVFRRNDKDPESKCGPRSISKWMDSLSDMVGFLGEERARELTYYDTRHSVNDLIKKAPAESKETYWFVKRAAEVHLRHDGDIENGDVNDTNYTKEIEPDEYKAIIKAALDFPWEIEELEEWEREWLGHHDPVAGVVVGTQPVKRSDSSSITDQPSPPVSRDDELEYLKGERERLRSRPKDMSLAEWTEKLKEINKKLSVLEREG